MMRDYASASHPPSLPPSSLLDCSVLVVYFDLCAGSSLGFLICVVHDEGLASASHPPSLPPLSVLSCSEFVLIFALCTGSSLGFL